MASSDSFSIKVEGLADLQRKLAKVQGGVRGRIIPTALKAGALPIQNAWKRRVPVKTGNYMRSIAIAGVNQHAVQVGTSLSAPPYPVFLEYGTRNMAARPSARPAFDETKQEAVNEVGSALRELIEGAFR